ncbi:hypothetical protein D9756_008581 [Leucocoprinus leucothites]|uniref:F-box domain-containing protein n=1 Tax=Leucocoprinus leucothites TaxID=201217 RepID=A0A8H5CYV4_9AGAR|nr:hypothetical protein D9756_008581 [Leucoagaricus leucothites]
MHPCLQTYDIQERICQHLAFTDSLDALANLARTCSAFLDPALNALWHTIPSLEPLVKCLPEDAWAVRRMLYRQSVLTLKRKTTPEDWERCKFYAHRIRRYGIEDVDKLDSMKGAMQTDKTFYLAFKPPSDPDCNKNNDLTSAPAPLLALPNLHACRLVPYTSYPIPHYSPFLAPTLRSLDMRIPSPICVGETTIIGLLRTLPTACPDLRNLSLYGVDIGLKIRGACHYEATSRESEIDELLINTLRGLRHLESLQCPYIWFPTEAVRHLATRLKLHTLSVKNTAENIVNALKLDNQEEEKEHPWFEHLKDLSVECSPRGGLLEAVELLKHVPNITRITTLDVARTGGIPTETELRGFIQSLSDLTIATPRNAKVNSTLKSLHIHQGDETGFLTPAERPTPVSKYTTTLSTLAPLLDFPQLSELSVMVDTRFSLDDDDAQQMARAWPKLKQLELGFCGGGWGQEGRTFSLDGLRAFASNCPDLEELGVSVTISSAEPVPALAGGEQGVEQQQGNEGEETTGTVVDCEDDEPGCHKLRYLELGDSVYFGEPERVARSLLSIFPSLSRVYGPGMAMSPEWEKKWMRVSKLAQEMQGSSSAATTKTAP